MVRHYIQTIKKYHCRDVPMFQKTQSFGMNEVCSELQEIHGTDTAGQNIKYNTSIYKIHHVIIHLFTKYSSL